MALPKYKTESKEFEMLQTNWATQLDPVVALPINKGLILPSIPLVIGTNQVNHKLGRKLQGWWVVRQRAAASIYDEQDLQMNPTLMLALVSSANVTIDLFVF